MPDTENKSLAVAFGDSLAEDTIGCIGEYAELGIDAVLDEGLLKDIPVISTAVTLYKIGSSIRDRHNLKKLAAFLDEINKGIADNKQRLEYQNKFRTDEKTRNEQLEYLVILIDRYTSYDKPRMLAKLFMAYLNEILSWEELLMYAEVIDRLLPLDCDKLISASSISVFHSSRGTEPFLRLSALGLMIEESDDYRLDPNPSTSHNKRIYRRTGFGSKLAGILQDNRTMAQRYAMDK